MKASWRTSHLSQNGKAQSELATSKEEVGLAGPKDVGWHTGGEYDAGEAQFLGCHARGPQGCEPGTGHEGLGRPAFTLQQ